MKKRILTGSLILLVTIIFVASRMYTPYAFDLFIGILAIIGTVEVARVLERKRMFTNTIFVGCFPAIMYVALLIGLKNNRDWQYFVLYFVIILFSLFLINFLYTFLFSKITKKEKDKYGVYESDALYGFKKSMNSLFIVFYPTVLFSTLFVINHLFEFNIAKDLGVQNTNLFVVFLLTFIFAVTMLTDTFALLVGRVVQGPKLCPTISPNKTISGAVGGFVFGTAGSLLVYYLFSLNTIFSSALSLLDITWWKILIIAMVTSVVGQIGDLVASALKRSARVKDYGTLFPGHGGVMDRVDGLIFNSFTVLLSMLIIL